MIPKMRRLSCMATDRLVNDRYRKSGSIANSVDTNKHILCTERYGNIPTGTPLTGASNAVGQAEIAILDQYLASSRVINTTTARQCSRCIVPLKLITDQASRGLSATAKLPVSSCTQQVAFHYSSKLEAANLAANVVADLRERVASRSKADRKPAANFLKQL